jgi:hypothetical protein
MKGLSLQGRRVKIQVLNCNYLHTNPTVQVAMGLQYQKRLGGWMRTGAGSERLLPRGLKGGSGEVGRWGLARA